MRNMFALGYGLIFSGLTVSIIGYSLIGMCMVMLGFLIHVTIVNLPF